MIAWLLLTTALAQEAPESEGQPASEPVADTDSEPVADTDTDTDTDTEEPPEPTVISDYTLDVLDKGSRPRRVLASRRPAVGTSFRRYSFTRTWSSMAVPGTKPESEQGPTQLVVFDIDVTEHHPDGTWTEQGLVRATRVLDQGDPTPSTQERVDELVNVLPGLEVHMPSHPHGLHAQSAYVAPAGATPDQLAMVARTEASTPSPPACPRPERKLGEGARWTATRTVTVSGITYQERFTYTLKTLDQDSITCTMVLSQTAQPQHLQRMEADGDVPATDWSLARLVGSGSGTATVSLVEPSQDTRTWTVKQSQVLSVTVQGQGTYPVELSYETTGGIGPGEGPDRRGQK